MINNAAVFSLFSVTNEETPYEQLLLSGLLTLEILRYVS